MNRKRKMTNASVLAVALMTGAAALPALGHHGFRGAYDATSPMFVEGTVQEVTIAYPHVEMQVRVATEPAIPDELPRVDVLEIADARSKLRPIESGEYEVQLAGTEFVTALDGRIAPGDTVALIALRNCQPPHEVRSRWIRLADGDIVTVSGATQAEVQGCDNV